MQPELEPRARRLCVGWLPALLAFCLTSGVLSMSNAQTFVRGDANNDSLINIADPIFSLNHLFNGGAAPLIPNAMDSNDNGELEIADVAYILRALFQAGPNPPAPFPTAGLDTTPPDFPAGPTGAVTFTLSDDAGCPGAQVRMNLCLTSTTTIESLSARLVFDDTLLSLVTVDSTPLEALLGNTPDFFSGISPVAGEVSIGTHFSLIDPTGLGLPPQTDTRIIDLVFALDPTISIGSVLPIDFEDAPLASPPGYNLVSVLGEVERATLVGGSITADCTQTEFRRGDANEDGTVSISDAVFIIAYLFLAGAPSTCLITGDTNADASVDVGDVVFQLNALFSGGAAIPAPFPDCGPDPTGSGLACPSYAPICP